MCQLCSNRDSLSSPAAFSLHAQKRRSVLTALGSLPFAALATAPVAHAQQPPKPDNTLTPDQALERLLRGNERYMKGQSEPINFAATRAALTQGQNPYACILGCADSRVSPEFCFDEERGDLFVTRVAGNYVTTALLASIEYTVAVLHTPLIMVLGHAECGAVKAAIDAEQNQTDFPGHIQSITTALAPAVRQAKAQQGSGNLLNLAIRQNVRLAVEQLRLSNPILRARVQQGSLKVVGGLYHLDTGKVELVET
jgi:carbonic anhydrase